MLVKGGPDRYLSWVRIDPSHKYHNSSDEYHTMHHLLPEMCILGCVSVKNGALGVWNWWIWGFVQRVYWDGVKGTLPISYLLSNQSFTGLIKLSSPRP